MTNPFAYSKSRHQRTESPPSYKRYQQFKSHLRREFVRQCVYCRALDQCRGVENFGVDHYRPKKHFPHLEAEYLNLYYACNRCNSLKRDYWPSSKQMESGHFIPNPCDHVMFDHLRYRDGEVSDHSVAGKMTVEMLDLNEPNIVQFRRSVVASLERCEREKAKLVREIEIARKALKRQLNREEQQAILSEVDVLAQLIRDFEGEIRGFLGED